MSIPTVNVTVVVNGQDGNPIEGANVTAKLDREDRYNGLVVRKTLRGKTDANGELVLALFPNALGTNSSQYVVSIQTKEGTQRYTAYVPNEDCYLMSIVDLEPAPALSVAQIAIRDANAARAAAEGYADDAQASAQEAAASESTATTMAGNAAASAAGVDAAKAAAETAQGLAEAAREGAEAARDDAQATASSVAALVGALPTVGSGSGDVPTNTIADGKYVPVARTVAGHALSGDVAITAEDVGLGNVANAAQIPKSLLTVPGDIIVATASATPARLGVGSVGSPLVVSPSGLPAYGQRGPGAYFRDTRFAAKTVSVAADRYCLLSPNRMLVDINGVAAELTAQQTLDLSLAATWDSVSTDYRVAANRAGKDFYVYACINAGALKLLVSANSTYPSGFDATTSRKIGGFHCLCSNVGTISGHTLSGYLAGDILPASVWDLKHRPVCAPEGMVYVDGLGKWVDIYLASVSGGKLVSAYNATCADGASSPAFHWYKFSQWFGAVGKRMLTQTEFVAASLGSNQGTNITGSADPGTTGGKSDTAGRRMISNVGCEDCCGNLWQWGEEAGGGESSAAWVNAYDGNDAGVASQHYQAPNRALLGGAWFEGACCGSRGSSWNNGPLALYSYFGARGVAEPLAAE